jgi:hypothetical protein
MIGIAEETCSGCAWCDASWRPVFGARQVLIDDCEFVTKNERVPMQHSSYFFWRAEQGWPSRIK